MSQTEPVNLDHAPGLLVAAPHRKRDRFVAAVGIVGMVAVLLGHRAEPAIAAALATVVAVSTWLSIVDFRQHRLPNRIVGPLAAAVVLGLLVGSLVEGDAGRGLRAAGLGLAAAAVLLAANLLGGLGMGDVKYGFPWAATVGWFGWPPLSVAVLITTISGAVVAVAILIGGQGRGRHLPYGPYMALGLVGGLLAAAP